MNTICDDGEKAFVTRAMQAIKDINLFIKETVDAEIRVVEAKYPDRRLDISGPIQKLKEGLQSANAPSLDLNKIRDGIREIQKKHSPEMERIVLKEEQLRAKLAEITNVVNTDNAVEYFAGYGERTDISRYLRELLPTDDLKDLRAAALAVMEARQKSRRRIPYKKFWIPITGVFFLGFVAFAGLVATEDLKLPAYAGIALLALIGGQIVGGISYGLYRFTFRIPTAHRLAKIKELTDKHDYAAALEILLREERYPYSSLERGLIKDLKKSLTGGTAGQMFALVTKHLNEKDHEKASQAFMKVVEFVSKHLDWLGVDRLKYQCFLDDIQKEMLKDGSVITVKDMPHLRSKLRYVVDCHFSGERDVGTFEMVVDSLIGSAAARSLSPKEQTH